MFTKKKKLIKILNENHDGLTWFPHEIRGGTPVFVAHAGDGKHMLMLSDGELGASYYYGKIIPGKDIPKEERPHYVKAWNYLCAAREVDQE